MQFSESSKKCFICEKNVETFIVIQKEVSKYTNTIILNIFDQLIGDNNDWSSLLSEGLVPNVCLYCLEKINEYDLACETVKRVGEELTTILTKALDNLKAKIPFDEYDNEESYKIENPTEYSIETGTGTTEIKFSINEQDSITYCPSPEVGNAINKVSSDIDLEINGVSGHCNNADVSINIINESNEPDWQDRTVSNQSEDSKNRTIKYKYKCSNINCGAEFEKRPEYLLHRKKTGHLTEYKCDVCGKIYRSRVPYTDHIAIHISGALYECDICGTKFTHKGSLKRHNIIHAGVKKYQCDLCGKQFIHRTSLITHIYFHNKVGGRKCDLCGVTVPPHTSLNSHMMTHTDVKPYECGTCKKKFNKPGNLRGHIMKIHQGITIVTTKPCTFCSKTFPNNIKLNNHLITTHEIELPNNETRRRFRRGKIVPAS